MQFSSNHIKNEQDIMNMMNRKPRRTKAKIEKTNDEFKEHESVIMKKRIAEINNVITKKSHQIWHQFLFYKKKPKLQFHFNYLGINNYLKKCDEYKEEHHKDNKQKWWNNQKASEMSQDFLPSVLKATDDMARFLGSFISKPLQNEFTNYVIFELLETAITSVFSTQRSGSNEVFLRTSFQYAKADLRKKLESYFVDGELRYHDAKSRKKKDLWQTLIKEKKERLLKIFQNKKTQTDDYNRPLATNRFASYQPQPQQARLQSQSRSISNCVVHPNQGGYVQQQQQPIHVQHYVQSHAPRRPQRNMDHDIRCKIYDDNGYYNRRYQEAKIPPLPPVTVQARRNNYNNHNMNNNNHNNHNGGCRQCGDYMMTLNKCTTLLRENQRLLDETINLKAINNRNQSEKIYWKQQYEKILSDYNNLKQQQQQIQQSQQPQPPQQQPQHVMINNQHFIERNVDCEGEDDEGNINNNLVKNTPSYSMMSVSKVGGGGLIFDQMINSPINQGENNMLTSFNHPAITPMDNNNNGQFSSSFVFPDLSNDDNQNHNHGQIENNITPSIPHPPPPPPQPLSLRNRSSGNTNDDNKSEVTSSTLTYGGNGNGNHNINIATIQNINLYHQ